MKKIAIFQKDLKVGGIQKSLINLLNAIDTNKFKIDLYLFDKDNFYKDEINSNITINYLKPYHYFNRLIPFNILKKICKCKIDNEYDIAIDFNSYSNECAINTIKIKSNSKYIYAHNDVKLKEKYEYKYRILSFFFKKKYTYFDKIIAVSNGVKESFVEKYNFNKDKIIVIPNLIDTNEIIKKSKEKCDIKFDNNKYNLISVGRLVYQKGYDILIKIFKNICDKKSNFHLYIIGSGPEEIMLKKLVKRLNLTNDVSFLGAQNNPYKYMKQADGFILTSRYEGQGIVFLEAKCLDLKVFMPKHLEKYIDEIKGTDDIEKSVLESVKKNKKINELYNYNKTIIQRLEKLFENGDK